jgi:hypothetical protein
MMEQWSIAALLIGSVLGMLAATRAILDLLFHLMTLGRQEKRLQEAAPGPPASL